MLLIARAIPHDFTKVHFQITYPSLNEVAFVPRIARFNGPTGRALHAMKQRGIALYVPDKNLKLRWRWENERKASAISRFEISNTGECGPSCVRD